MPEFKDILLVTGLPNRGSGRGSEGTVGGVDDGPKVVGGNDRGGDKKGEDFEGEFWERKTSPPSFPVFGKGRDVGGDVETA